MRREKLDSLKLCQSNMYLAINTMKWIRPSISDGCVVPFPGGGGGVSIFPAKGVPPSTEKIISPAAHDPFKSNVLDYVPVGKVVNSL